jgi:magnesium-transporting ATPase (P-type)
MATQTRFDLNAALENWRKELAAQPQLTPEDRRELEKHLADSMAELRQRGLSEEESFWLARRRIGQPQQLAEEFEKAEPGRVWQERFFWMAVALVGSYLFVTWKDLLATWVNQSAWVEAFYFIPAIVLIGSIVMVRRNRLPIRSHLPIWKMACGLLVILAATVLTAYFRGRNLPSDNLISAGYDIGLVLSWLGNAVWPAVVVLIVLFTQIRNRKACKPA